MLQVQEVYAGYYKDINILQGVSIRAREGQITSIIGANGVGKSTLLKTICGFLIPAAGKVLFNEKDITGIQPYNLLEIGVAYIPQNHTVFPQMTVEENLQLGAWTFRREKKYVKEKIEENYTRFPVLRKKKNQATGNLSGGQQRMVEVARALMSKPDILLLDEPTTGLAPKMAREIYEEIVKLKEEGITILLVDQHIRQAVDISNYVYVLELGRNKVEGLRENFSNLKEVVKGWF